MIMSFLSLFLPQLLFSLCALTFVFWARQAFVSCALISLDCSHVMRHGGDYFGLKLEWHFSILFFLSLLQSVNALKDFIITKSICAATVFLMLCLVIYCVFKRALGILGKTICIPCLSLWFFWKTVSYAF